MNKQQDKYALGVDKHGEAFKIYYNSLNNIWCESKDFVSLMIDPLIPPNMIFCFKNELTELKIPQGTVFVFCHTNKLTELHLPEGLKKAFCAKNQLKKLNIPSTLESLECDPDLFDYDTCEVDAVNIIYPDVVKLVNPFPLVRSDI